MAQKLFYFVVYTNGVIIQRENGVSFESNAPVMFRNTCVSTLRELKAVGRSAIWHIDFRRLMRIIDWSTDLLGLARTTIYGLPSRCIGGLCKTGSWSFMPSCVRFEVPVAFVHLFLPVAPAPIHVVASGNVAMVDYNSGEDSDYEEESSCDNTKGDEAVPNTPTVGGPRLVFPASPPIHDLAEVGELSSWWGTRCETKRREVRKIGSPHTCLAPIMTEDHSQLDSTLMTNVVLPLVKKNPSVSILLL
ncbi:hypothetical protein PIB30_030614 [Stylosanthes scabra]|uniref:Uncharacterized protein n=1 Tax=Stylosanthes scabra TaxID=79078 RepID=A0ABU6XA16_9FABA|nr:hypothetical protein [Stylosanthes scabra]